MDPHIQKKLLPGRCQILRERYKSLFALFVNLFGQIGLSQQQRRFKLKDITTIVGITQLKKIIKQKFILFNLLSNKSQKKCRTFFKEIF